MLKQPKMYRRLSSSLFLLFTISLSIAAAVPVNPPQTLSKKILKIKTISHCNYPPSGILFGDDTQPAKTTNTTPLNLCNIAETNNSDLFYLQACQWILNTTTRLCKVQKPSNLFTLKDVLNVNGSNICKAIENEVQKSPLPSTAEQLIKNTFTPACPYICGDGHHTSLCTIMLLTRQWERNQHVQNLSVISSDATTRHPDVTSTKATGVIGNGMFGFGFHPEVEPPKKKLPDNGKVLSLNVADTKQKNELVNGKMKPNVAGSNVAILDGDSQDEVVTGVIDDDDDDDTMAVTGSTDVPELKTGDAKDITDSAKNNKSPPLVPVDVNVSKGTTTQQSAVKATGKVDAKVAAKADKGEAAGKTGSSTVANKTNGNGSKPNPVVKRLSTVSPTVGVSSEEDINDQVKKDDEIFPAAEKPATAGSNNKSNLKDDKLSADGDLDDMTTGDVDMSVNFNDGNGMGDNNFQQAPDAHKTKWATEPKVDVANNVRNFEYADSHFFTYFLTVVVLCIVVYLVFHNKQKIIALIVEGRQNQRKRPNTTNYKKLDSSLEEAMQSSVKATSSSHVIF